MKSALILTLSNALMTVLDDTFNVFISTSIGMGHSHNSINGMTLVDRVNEENHILSHFFILPRFNNDWMSAKFAELQLLKNVQCFLHCHSANFFSNFLQYAQKLKCGAIWINSQSLSFVVCSL